MAAEASSTDRLRLEPAIAALQVQLTAQPGIAGPVAIERQFDAGQSNPTYLLRAGERRLVLRKQPYGKLLPRAHDVLRESRIMTALGQVGYPVPRPVLSGDGTDGVGTAYFVMDYVPGSVASDPALPDRTPAERTTIYRAMAETLADLHRLDPGVLQPAGVTARPDFLTRQVTLWQAQYAASATEPEPLIGEVAGWLLANQPPPSRPAIVHGDYRIENLILAGTTVAAVLDWELCAIGDPLCDLAYCCLWYHLPPHAFGGLAEAPLESLGIPDQAAFVATYAARSGLPVDGLNYYLAFAFYRLAAILQGVYRRALDGNAASTLGKTRGAVAQLCLSRAASFAFGNEATCEPEADC